jgi:predicted HTH transcriptional regulator
MAEVFYVAGEMEKTGRGMYLISNTMKEAGRKLPEWSSANGKTTLRIYSKKEELKPNERIHFFMSKRKAGQYFTKMEYVEAFEKKPSKGTAQNDLLLMVNLGLCEKEGDGPSTRYRWK